MKTHASVKVLFSCGKLAGRIGKMSADDCAGHCTELTLEKWGLAWNIPENHASMLWLLLFLLFWCSCYSDGLVVLVLVVISSRTCNKAEEQRGKQKSEKAEKAENKKIKRSEAKQN